MNRWFQAAGAASELVSIDRFVDSHVFATQSGAYGGTFRLNGRDPECLSDADLADLSARLVQAMRLLPENGSLYQMLVKCRGCNLPLSRYADAADEIVAETQRKRHAYLATRRLGTVELYWTVCMHPPRSRKPPKPAEHAAGTERLLRELRNTLTTLEQNLADLFGLDRLDCQAIGRLYGHLANLDPKVERRRLSSFDRVNRQLARSPLFWHSRGLTIGRRHARLFSLIQRPGATRPNLFGELIRLDADLILVLESRRQSTRETRRCVSSHQSFRDLFRHSLLSILAHARSGKEIAKSANTVAADKAVDDLGLVVDDIENRGLTYSQASLIGLLHSESEAELDDQIAQVHRVFGQSDAAVIEEGIGSLSAYYSLFPAASRYGQSFNVRRWWVREDHLSHLSLVYAPYTGEPRSEALEDEALAVFETRDRTPFYFDPYQNGLRGLLVIGSPRRGKSFVINFLLDMEPKYGGFLFLFDIGGSYESTVLKHGGRVVRFGLGGPRLNPFALPPTAENIEFLYRLIRLLLAKGGAALQPVEDRDLYERVQAMYSLSPEIRRLKHLILAPHLQPYLAKWIEAGVYGRIFDNIEDELQLARIVVFDFQAVEGEEHRDLMEPLLLWIRWQTAAVMHDIANLDVPKVEVFDECWKHMQDPAMLSLILRSSKTAGKHLGGIILATHAADDLGAHTRLIRNACTDTLFLGGPFDREQYRELFDLHDRQLDRIAGLERGESLLVRPGYSKVLVTSVDAESAWHYTTRPKDRARREVKRKENMRILLSLCIAAMLGAADSPQPVTIDGPRSVTVGERSVVSVFICPLQETLLILPANEKVMKSFVADTANWKLESGREDQASRYLSIKVREPLTRETTLNVVSDHEANYTFKLVLNEQHCDSKVSIDADSQLTETVRKTEPWLSPAEAERMKQQVEQAKQASIESQRKTQAEADAWRASYPSRLHFDYRWDPKAAEKLGVHAIWHDDRFTYISGTPEETPALYELKEGKPSLISFDFANGVYWTGRIVNDGYLAVGGNGNGKHQEKLEFHRAAEGN